MRRKAVFIRIVNTVLALCLVLVCTLFTGLTQGEHMAMDALEQLGKPYRLGEEGPDRFDCSGLVLCCAEREGIIGLPRLAKDLYHSGRPVPLWALLPGDMLCFDTERDADPCDHVGIWLGGNRFVHASSAKRKVIITELTGYYLEHCTGARRIASPYF